MSKKKYKTKKKITKARKSKPKYSKGTVRIYHSFEEAERADLQYAADQNPIERLRETVELILRVYGVTREMLLKQKPNNRVTITYNE